MLVGSCERRRHGFLARLAGLLSGCVSRVLVAACLTAAWAPVATCLSPAIAMAQDEEVAVDDAVDAEPDGKSYLAFLVEALGIKYVIIFLLLSFALVALLVMCFMQFRKSVLLPPTLSEQFEQHLENKEFQQAYELAKTTTPTSAGCSPPAWASCSPATRPQSRRCRRPKANRR